MAGVFEGIVKLLGRGGAQLQHQQFIARLRGLQLEEAQVQLASYVRGMPEFGFDGLKLALSLLALNAKTHQAAKLWQGLAQSLDTVRSGTPQAAPDARARVGTSNPVQPVMPAVAPLTMASFQDDLDRCAQWIESEPEAFKAALFAHVSGLSSGQFRAFGEHVEQMVSNARSSLERHKASEGNAWGGSFEDRLSYGLARHQTGQRDPKYMQRLRQLEGFVAQFEYIAQAADLVWHEQQREAERAHQSQQDHQAAVISEPEDLAATGFASEMAVEQTPVENALATMRSELEQGLASGAVRGERRAVYERFLDKLGAVMVQLSDPNTAVDERQKLLERFKGLMAEYHEFYVSPGPAGRLDGVPEGARARLIAQAISNMKGVLYRQLTQTPGAHTSARAEELLGDLTRADQEICRLIDDDAVAGFEHELLRGTAQGLHDLALREHLMVGHPLWQCDQVVPSPNGLFYAGSDDARGIVQSIALRSKLELLPTTGTHHGQACWDSLRACHVGVFDLRSFRPNLAKTGPQTAAVLAATAYQVGLAWGIGKPVIILTSAGADLPFDIDVGRCELSGDAHADEQAIVQALDAAWYERQRTSGASCLSETLEYLDRATVDHPRRSLFVANGAFAAQQLQDPVGLAGSVRQLLRERGLSELEVLFPAWPGRYPDPESPCVFHVMPFSEPWSDATRDAAREACARHGYQYRRGDESLDAAIIPAIWQDIGRAHLVVVDLTGLNLNVAIELGLAHALGRKVLATRRAGSNEPLPRNIEKLRVLEYETAADLARLLESRLTAIA